MYPYLDPLLRVRNHEMAVQEAGRVLPQSREHWVTQGHVGDEVPILRDGPRLINMLTRVHCGIHADTQVDSQP